MTLAYLFWHWPAPGVDAGAYARDLAAFHEALALSGSHSVRLEVAPFDGAGPHTFEDWYPVDGWAALGELNERAVDARRRAPHDAVATAAGGGAGGVYRLVRGAARQASAEHTRWLPKPPGTTRAAFVDHLAAEAPGAPVWQRQMVLGPAPEFAVHCDAPLSLPWPSIATRPTPLRPPA